MQIMVRDNNVDQALRALKKKLQREGVYREMKLRRHYEKPSEKRSSNGGSTRPRSAPMRPLGVTRNRGVFGTSSVSVAMKFADMRTRSNTTDSSGR